MEGMRKLENRVEHVKTDLTLARDFEKKLVEIDAGIHGEASGLITKERVVTDVKENSVG